MSVDTESLSSGRPMFSRSLSTGRPMLSQHKGESEVEKLAAKILKRRENRVRIIYSVRVKLIETCRKIAKQKNPDELHKIHLKDLRALRETVREQASNQKLGAGLLNLLGAKTDTQNLVEVLDHAVEVVEKVQLDEDDYFHYQEFNFYHTKVESRWPLMRYPVLNSYVAILLFYLCTPLLFCVLLEDEGVCHAEGDVPGWLSALYFASTTMSTVGYGDLTVEKNHLHVVIGTWYMILAMVVAITAFTAVADNAFSPLSHLSDFFLQRSIKVDDTRPLYKRVRRIKLIIVAEVAILFVVFNLIGASVSWWFAGTEDLEVDYEWTWWESIYWAVQTTTTIGYGDMPKATWMRVFNIFYLSISPYVIGLALGKLANMMKIVETERAEFAYRNRRVSKHMIYYMKTDPERDSVDQFEFFVGSLLNLEKITIDDVEIVMDKFRSLESKSTQKGFICASGLPTNLSLNVKDEVFKEAEAVPGM